MSRLCSRIALRCASVMQTRWRRFDPTTLSVRQINRSPGRTASGSDPGELTAAELFGVT